MTLNGYRLVLLLSAALLVWAGPAYAQCDAYMLACLDEDQPVGDQQLVITIWTGDSHCLASGYIDVLPEPYYDGVILGEYEPRFENVFSNYHTIRIPVVGNGASYPPGTVVNLGVYVAFDDPGYSGLSAVEPVVIADIDGRLEQYRPGGPCVGDAVPAEMLPMTSACFVVCHRIYRVHLTGVPMFERPVIIVTPGCTGDDSCPVVGCTPGGAEDYRWGLDNVAGEWYLEFEYSNASLEPVCYCVRYTGTQVYTGYGAGLVAVDELWQTLDLTLWNTDTDMCGEIEVFSYPPGALIGSYFPEVYAPPDEKRTSLIAVGPGGFTTDQEFKLAVHVQSDPGMCSAYDAMMLVEDVVVTPEGGLQIVDVGGECTDTQVPPSMIPGSNECIKVCHDIYHIVLEGAAGGTPEVSVTPGCGPPTVCPDLLGCLVAGPNDYRYDLIQVGGSWVLEFEHSNPEIEPACYCIEYTGVTFGDPQANVLVALDEANQTLDVTLWTDQTCEHPASGQITVSKGPYDLDPDVWVESFFDVFTVPRHWEVPVGPGMYGVGENFLFEVAVDFFGPGSDPFEGQVAYERAVVTPGGLLAPWYPQEECTGDNVPFVMSVGQAECFEVCHRIYDVVLGGTGSPMDGEPIITVTPGCGLPCLDPGCVHGGPFDYCYRTWFDGMQWHLEFEYSNVYIEPVCYCVTYEGHRPNCYPHELVALDERDQLLQITLWVTGDESPPCLTSGHVEVCRSDEPLVVYDPFPGGFTTDDVFLTGEVPGDNGNALPTGTQVQFTVHVDYDEPYEDTWITEEVIVGPTGQFEIDDTGAECTGDNVPAVMEPGVPYCFKVCHQVYHIDLNANDPMDPPEIHIDYGCPFEGICPPDPECIPGGEYDYCYQVVWVGDHWELEFEYSNEEIEPVCYCVSFGELPGTELEGLIAVDPLWQTVDVTIWNTTGSDLCGTITLSSNPPGAWIAPYTPDFYTADQPYTIEVPVGAGTFLPGQTFDLVAYIEHTGGPCDVYYPLTLVDDVVVTPEGGLVTDDVGGECSDFSVPSLLSQGQAECFKVCHDIYYTVLDFVGPGTPIITVTPGCGPPTACPYEPGCIAGHPDHYRYDVYRIGGTWILEFEYSNPNIEPVCYCVEFSGVTPVPHEAYLLAALDEANQTLDVTLWTDDCTCEHPASGTITVSKGPYDLDPDAWVESFFDVFCEPFHWEFPVNPGTFTTGQNFQYEVVVDFFFPGSEPWTGVIELENVTVTPTGGLEQWYPQGPCTGDNVPSFMASGTSECFVVCHRIYDVLLEAGPTDGPPIINVTPGCDSPCVDPGCVSGGPYDYCYRTWFDGANWHLEFEYSNPAVEPVCYCVTYEGWQPNCQTEELVALDERDQTLDVTLWARGSEAFMCNPWAAISVCSSLDGPILPDPPPVQISPDWTTVEVPVTPGTALPGQAFQFVVVIDYDDPYEDVLITEDVIVDGSGAILEINDVGGECTGDVVPAAMERGVPYCFKVCHRVYHIDLGATDPMEPPTIIVEYGCPPEGTCPPDPECIPGGPYDYRYDVIWVGDHWELEFEYSREDLEPVCYCVMADWEVTEPCWELPLDGSITTFRFPPEFIGTMATSEVWAVNVSGHTLTDVMATVDCPYLSLPVSGPFTVADGETLRCAVEYTPAVPGYVDCGLTLTSDGCLPFHAVIEILGQHEPNVPGPPILKPGHDCCGTSLRINVNENYPSVEYAITMTNDGWATRYYVHADGSLQPTLHYETNSTWKQVLADDLHAFNVGDFIESRVRARHRGIETDWGPIGSYTMPECPDIAPPEELTVIRDGDDIVLRWEPTEWDATGFYPVVDAQYEVMAGDEPFGPFMSFAVVDTPGIVLTGEALTGPDRQFYQVAAESNQGALVPSLRITEPSPGEVLTGDFVMAAVDRGAGQMLEGGAGVFQVKLGTVWTDLDDVMQPQWIAGSGIFSTLVDASALPAGPCSLRIVESSLYGFRTDGIEVTINRPPEPQFDANCSVPGLILLDGTPSSDPDGSITGYVWTFEDHSHQYGSGAAISVADGDTAMVTLETNDDYGVTEFITVGVLCYEMVPQIIGPQCGCVSMEVNTTGKIKGKKKSFPAGAHTIDDGDATTTDDDQSLGPNGDPAPNNPNGNDTAQGSYNFEVRAKLKYDIGHPPGDCEHYQKFQLDEKCNGVIKPCSTMYGSKYRDWDHRIGGGTWADDDYDDESENSFRLHHEGGDNPEVDWIDGPMRTHTVNDLKKCKPGGISYECIFCGVVDGPLGCCRCKFKVTWTIGPDGQFTAQPAIDTSGAGFGCTTGAQGTCGC